MPSHQNDPVEGFLPIQNDSVNYLAVTNDGLMPASNPHQKVIDFWKDIERRAFNLSAKAQTQKLDESK